MKALHVSHQSAWGGVSLLFLFSLCLLFSAKSTTSLANTDATSFYSNFENQTFTDQNNRAFPIVDLKGKVTLFNFIFTQCSTVCSVQTKELVKVKKSLSPELNNYVRFVSVSLDPLNDKPEVLKTFAKRTGADMNGWSFVTGKPQSIQQVIERLQLFGDKKQVKEAKRPDDHTTNLWLIDENGRLMQRYNGSPLDARRLAQEISKLHEMHVAAAKP